MRQLPDGAEHGPERPERGRNRRRVPEHPVTVACQRAMLWSAGQPANARPQFLVARVRVDRRGEWRYMPREPLRQEQVARLPVDIRDRAVTKRMKGVQPVEPSLYLPCPERELDAAGGDAGAGPGTEEWSPGLYPPTPRPPASP